MQLEQESMIAIGHGALLDNASILLIKEQKFAKDPAKLARVELEKAQYQERVTALLTQYPALVPLYKELIEMNEKLWDAEEKRREIEQDRSEEAIIEDLTDPQNKPLLVEYLKLVRGLSRYNDARASLKKRISEITGSKIAEVKSHAAAQ